MTSTLARQWISPSRRQLVNSPSWLPALAAAGVVTYLAPRVISGADTMWMVALGGHVAGSRAVPVGVPFAASDTREWPNVPVLGELVLYAVHSLGPSALGSALLIAGVSALLLLAQDAMRGGAHPAAGAVTVVLAAAGMLPVLGVIRAQMLSLAPFAILLALLRAEERSPTRRIWLAVPLLAVWGNLHGGVLVGVALTGCYLVLARLKRQPRTAVLVGLASVAAIFANPALARTGNYYLGVISNEAARRGSEMWAKPDLSSPFDLLMVLAAVGLGVLAVRWARMPMWEVAATLGMAVATATSARHGMWLLMFLMGPAAIGLTKAMKATRLDRVPPPPSPAGEPRQSVAGRAPFRLVVPAITIALIGVAVVTVASRSQSLRGPSHAVSAIRSLAAGQVVLAPEPLAEDLAAAGVTVWASNPIDAFRPEDQAAYLDVWLGREGGRRAIEASAFVVAPPGSPAYGLAVSAGCTELRSLVGLAVLDCEN